MNNIEKIAFEISDNYISSNHVEINYFGENGEKIDEDSLCDSKTLNIITDNISIKSDESIKPVYVGVTKNGKELLFEANAEKCDKKYLKGYIITDNNLSELEKLKKLRNKIASDEEILVNMGFEVQKRR